MENILQWIQDNFNTLFSGLGVYIISLIVALLVYLFLRKKRSTNNVNMTNITAGGDVTGRDKKG